VGLSTSGCMRPLTARSLLTAALLTAALLTAAPGTHAQTSDPLPPETVLVAANGAPAPTAETFSIAAVAAGMTQPDLLVTFTDLQTPAALSAASVVVTQGDTIVASTPTGANATAAPLTLPAAVGQYTLRVIGTPDPNASPSAGSFKVCVAPKATPAACIADASIAGSIGSQSAPADPTLSTLSITLTIATTGSYTFTYADASFPVALQIAPTLALFQGSTPVAGAVPIPASPAAITLAAGTYTLLAFAQADATVKSGLYGIAISGPAAVVCQQSTTTIPCSSSYPVGLLGPASQVNNPSAQSVMLTATDFAFPAALASASAVVTVGGAVLGTATAGAGASSFMAPSGGLQVWSYGAAGPTTGGAYEVDLTAASGSLLQSDVGVSNGGLLAYAFVTPTPLAAGSYVATANDFQFPAALNGLQFAVAQNGAVLKSASVASSIDFTAAAGPAVLLAAATPAMNGNGLFDVNIQTGGNAPQLVFDQVQPVSASGAFTPQPITLAAAGSYDVTLTDLDFPAQFGTLAVIGSSHGAVLGKVYGGGTFTLSAAGNYQFFVIAIPAAATLPPYGLYGLQVLNSPPTVSLTASPTSVVAGGSTTLSWTTTNATACSGSGGAFSGSQAATGTGSASVLVSATTTYTLTCTGPGGSGSGTATVTATPAPVTSSGGGGGGGGIGIDWLCLLGALAVIRLRSIPFAARAG
jgi:hypothetical protein